MLSPANLHEYQRSAILHQLFCPQSMLHLDPGLGKTVITLTTGVHRMGQGQVQKMLIVGPLRVIHGVWRREAAKWEHLQHLRFTVLSGSKEQRNERLHINGSDVYLINYENLNWLAKELQTRYLDKGLPLPFQMVVYDEITKVKNSTSVRVAGRATEGTVLKMTKKAAGFKLHQYIAQGWTPDALLEHGYATRSVRTKLTGWRSIMSHFAYRTGLTGTPAANGYVDLHGQYLVIDDGQRLGTHVTHFREAYFQSDYMGWSYKPTEIGKQAIEHKIADITICMSAEDKVKMPELQVRDLWVDLPDDLMAKYREIESDLFTQLDCGTEIEVFNESSVSNKCLQFSNGACFVVPGQPEWAWVHDYKLDMLDSLIEEHGGKPILLGYNYRPDAQRILAKYKHAVDMGQVKGKNVEKTIQRWQDGDIRLLIGHPASMGHGIDGLQDTGGSIAWFGLPWSFELYDQMNRRLYRQGGRNKVTIYRIMTRGTLDIAVADRLRMKDDTQGGLRQAINRYRKGQSMMFRRQ